MEELLHNFLAVVSAYGTEGEIVRATQNISVVTVFLYEFLGYAALLTGVCFFLKRKGESLPTYTLLVLWAIGIAVLSSLIQKLSEYRDYYAYAFYLSMLIPILFSFSDGVSKKVFVFCSAFFMEVVFLGIFQTLSCTIFGEEYLSVGFAPFIVRFFIAVLQIFIFNYLVKGVLSIAKKSLREDIWYLLSLFPLVYAMCLVAIFVKNTVYPVDGASQLSFTLWAIMGLVGYFFIGRYIIMETERVENKNEIEMINKFIGMEKHYFFLLNESLNKARILRHDVKHHIAVLNSLNNAGDSKGIEKYLGAMLEGLESGEVKKLCSNDEINIILSHYLYKAESEGATIKFKLDLPKDLKIDITELTIIWGNILDNALRAVSEDSAPEQNKEIEVSCKCIGDKVIIMERNRFYGKVRRDVNGDFLTTKEGGGLGLKSIRAIAEKYGGDFTVHYEDNVYSVYVTLCGVV